MLRASESLLPLAALLSFVSMTHWNSFACVLIYDWNCCAAVEFLLLLVTLKGVAA